jgi:hypothetical protein
LRGFFGSAFKSPVGFICTVVIALTPPEKSVAPSVNF